jgi:hypothetical protein
MGRYLSRSELDYWMARAFSASEIVDRSRAYAGYALTAWSKPDIEVAPRRREMLRLIDRHIRRGDCPSIEARPSISETPRAIRYETSQLPTFGGSLGYVPASYAIQPTS